MGVITVSEYKTTDGKTFREKSDAEKHQFDLDYKKNTVYNGKYLTSHELAELLLQQPDLPFAGYGICRITLLGQRGIEVIELENNVPLM